MPQNKIFQTKNHHRIFHFYLIIFSGDQEYLFPSYQYISSLSLYVHYSCHGDDALKYWFMLMKYQC